jgi:hypothetical protein
MDNLEEFIRNNRENLDKYDPSDRIWKRIKTGLRKENTSLVMWLLIAAMIVIIIGTAVTFYKLGNTGIPNFKEKGFNADLLNNQPLIKETEMYYKSRVNSLYHEATPLLTGHPEIERELKTDMSQLDSICTDIKKDLKDNVANYEVIEALIQNYRIRIQLLEEMLSLLKESDDNSEKNKSHEL